MSKNLTRFQSGGYGVKEADGAVPVSGEREASSVNRDITEPASWEGDGQLGKEQNSSDNLQGVKQSGKLEPPLESTKSTSQTQTKDAEAKEETGEVELDLESGSIEKRIEVI